MVFEDAGIEPDREIPREHFIMEHEGDIASVESRVGESELRRFPFEDDVFEDPVDLPAYEWRREKHDCEGDERDRAHPSCKVESSFFPCVFLHL